MINGFMTKESTSMLSCSWFSRMMILGRPMAEFEVLLRLKSLQHFDQLFVMSFLCVLHVYVDIPQILSVESDLQHDIQVPPSNVWLNS